MFLLPVEELFIGALPSVVGLSQPLGYGFRTSLYCTLHVGIYNRASSCPVMFVLHHFVAVSARRKVRSFGLHDLSHCDVRTTASSRLSHFLKLNVLADVLIILQSRVISLL